MKGAAELLGVTYASLYGRYRESFGYLRKTNKQATKADLVLDQPKEKINGSRSGDTTEDEENYEDTVMEVQSDSLLNRILEDHFVFEEDIVEKVHSHYSNETS